MGEPNELRPGSGEFHENPSSCICQNLESEVKTVGLISISQNQTRNNHEGDRIQNRIEEHSTEEELEWSELDDSLDSGKQIHLRGTKNDSLPLLMGIDQTELQEFFSD